MSVAILVAGGGTGGHVEPALAFADALTRLDPAARVTALGTAKGLESRLVPARGYPLELIPPVPLPRRITTDLLRLPARLRAAVRAAQDVIDRTGAQVVVGFGGYVAFPAYLAARRCKVPIVVHEANARPGLANRIAARFTRHVYTASTAVRLPHAQAIGIPLRLSVSGLDRDAVRAEARTEFGLDPDRRTLLVTGGSQGARTLNRAATGAIAALRAAGIQVLHLAGSAGAEQVRAAVTAAEADPDAAAGDAGGTPGGRPPYVVLDHISQMHLAYAAADFVLARCGAMTVAELAAVGLPAAYVPYPHGNGEQRFNALPVVRAGAALLIDDAACTPEWVTSTLVPLLADDARMTAMGAAARRSGSRHADEVLARAVLALVQQQPDRPAQATRGTTAVSDQSGPGNASGSAAQPVFRRPEGWTAPGADLVRSAATEPVPVAAEMGHVHIIGIGGAGMSGLARIMLTRGMTVSGSDARDSSTVNALRALGATIYVGHDAAHLDGVDTVVYSTAIAATNPELSAARERGIRVVRRAAALAALIAGRRAVAVAGTHGKTSTTSLLTVAAQACGLDPSFAIGGNLYESGVNAHEGSGDLFIVEADESDGSFLMLAPQAAIITNVEADHLENHGDLAGVIRAFEMFVDRIVDGGVLVTCADDAGARQIAGYARGQNRLEVITYGTAADADVTISGIRQLPASVQFDVAGAVADQHVVLGALVGEHMARNGAGALALAQRLGMPTSQVAAAWAQFRGVHRRFELRGTAAGVRVYDDYAHHPTEIAATLAGARAATGEGRLIAVFQPGTFSRTQLFAREFAQAMAHADIAVVMDIYPAREEPIPGVTGAIIADAIDLPDEQVVYSPSWSQTAELVAGIARAGDLVVTMGIGDVYLLCPEILAAVDRLAAR